MGTVVKVPKKNINGRYVFGRITNIYNVAHVFSMEILNSFLVDDVNEISSLPNICPEAKCWAAQ